MGQLLSELRRISDPGLLKAQYVAVFDRPDGATVCPAFASAYVDEEGCNGNGIQRDVETFLAKRIPDWISIGHARADHIGVELEVVGRLLERASQAARDGLLPEAQAASQQVAAFLEAHVCCWFPRLRARILEASPTGVYAALAHATQEFLEEELHRTRRAQRRLD